MFPHLQKAFMPPSKTFGNPPGKTVGARSNFLRSAVFAAVLSACSPMKTKADPVELAPTPIGPVSEKTVAEEFPKDPLSVPAAVENGEIPNRRVTAVPETAGGRPEASTEEVSERAGGGVAIPPSNLRKNFGTTPKPIEETTGLPK